MFNPKKYEYGGASMRRRSKTFYECISVLALL